MCWKAKTLFCWQRPYSQGYGLPRSHAQLWELDHKEGRAPSNLCFQTVALERISESPLDSKEIKSVSLKWNQPWILYGGIDAEAETPVFWSSDVNNWLIGKVPDAGKVLLQTGEESIRGWVSLDDITNAMDMNLSKLSETVKDREACCASFHMVAKSQTWLGD